MGLGAEYPMIAHWSDHFPYENLTATLIIPNVLTDMMCHQIFRCLIKTTENVYYKMAVFGPSRISFSYFDRWRRAWKQRFSCMRTMSRFTSVPEIRPKSSEKKISLAKVTSGYAVLKSQANRSRTVDFGLHRLRKNGSFSMNRRS